MFFMMVIMMRLVMMLMFVMMLMLVRLVRLMMLVKCRGGEVVRVPAGGWPGWPD